MNQGSKNIYKKKQKKGRYKKTTPVDWDRCQAPMNIHAHSHSSTVRPYDRPTDRSWYIKRNMFTLKQQQQQQQQRGAGLERNFCCLLLLIRSWFFYSRSSVRPSVHPPMKGAMCSRLHQCALSAIDAKHLSAAVHKHLRSASPPTANQVAAFNATFIISLVFFFYITRVNRSFDCWVMDHEKNLGPLSATYIIGLDWRMVVWC